MNALAQSAVRTGQIDSRFSAEFVARMLEMLFSSLHLLQAAHDGEDAYSQLELALDMMQYGLCGKNG